MSVLMFFFLICRIYQGITSMTITRDQRPIYNSRVIVEEQGGGGDFTDFCKYLINNVLLNTN